MSSLPLSNSNSSLLTSTTTTTTTSSSSFSTTTTSTEGGVTTTPTTTPTTPATTPTPTPTTPTTQPTTAPTTQSVVTVSSTAQVPTSTQIFTSIITATPTQQTQPPTTIIVTPTLSTNGQQTNLPSSTTSAPQPTRQVKSSDGGLGTNAKVAIAVVIPIVAVAGLVILGLFLWRRRNKRRDDAEERRKEIEEYGRDPNNDPYVPGTMGAMKDEEGYGHHDDGHGGYRGWGAAAAAPMGIGRKTSTNASSAQHGYSDAGTLVQPGSPTYPADQPATHARNPTLDSDTMGNGYAPAGGAAVAAGVAGGAGGVLRRGVSNASSTYSNQAPSRHSDNEHPVPQLPGQAEYYDNNMYYQPSGPYDQYGGNGNGGQAVMREGPGRRLTQVQENGGGAYPQQGGIARNF